MKITESHYTFWIEHRAPTPTWAAAVAAKRGAVSIHYLINVQAGARLGTSNALHLLHLRMMNGDSPYVALQPSGWDRNNNPRRYWMFHRWRRKLVAARRRSGFGRSIQSRWFD